MSRKLTILFLRLIALLPLLLFAAKPIALTPAEQQWIANHPTLTAQNETDWPPYNFNDHGTPKGFSVDYLNLLASKLHLKVQYLQGKTWSDYMQQFRSGKLDLMLNIRKTKAREKDFLFTPPYVRAAKSIFTNLPGIHNLSDLNGKTVAIPKGYYIEEFLRAYYPGIRLILQPNLLQSLIAVASQKADAVVEDYSAINTLMQENGLMLRYTTVVEDARLIKAMNIGVTPRKPLLKTLLEKAMHAVTKEEMQSLNEKWLNTKGVEWHNHQSLNLTDAEAAFVAKHATIRMCNNPNWMPIEFAKDGDMHHMEGIAIDTLKLLARKLHVTFQNVPTQSWSQSQQFLAAKKCDILPAAIQTKKREQYARFSQPYLIYDLAIITRKDEPYVRDLDDLKEKVFARKRGSGLISKMKKRFPGISVLQTNTYLDSFRKVASGHAYYTIATLPVAAYFISRYQMDTLRIAGYTDMRYRLAIAVRDDMPRLVTVLDKALAQLTPEEKKRIFNRWTNVQIKEGTQGINPRIIYLILSVLGVFLFLLAVWYYHLKRSAKESQELLDATIEGIVIHRDGICIDVNKSMLTMLHLNTREELIGQNILDWVAPQSLDDAQAHWYQTYDKSYEGYILRKDGTRFPALIHGKSIRKKTERLVSVVDISQLKQQESIIAQQSKLAAMGEMIGNIAHQWRQPLSVISTIATGMKMQKQFGMLDDAEFLRNCDDINRQAQYLSQTIDDFRNFIKGSSRRSDFFLKHTFDEFLRLVEGSITSYHIDVQLDIDEHLQITGSETELIQCFLNIFNNAKDAFNANNPEERVLNVSAQRDQEMVQIRFQDNAGGIPESVLPRIFDPYFTTKHQTQGTGLGLYMTHQIIVEGMKGELTASNETFRYHDREYTGAVFTIVLPIQEAEKTDL